MEAVILNSAGGITGGDSFDIEARAGTGSRLTLTTQAAERAYRAQPGEVGRVATRLRVENSARLDWLPQELILYQGGNLERRLDIALSGDAQLLMVEPVIFGRRAMGEHLSDARLSDRIRITRDGAPLYLDGAVLEGDLTRKLALPAIGNNAGAMASVVYVAPDATTHLAPIRSTLPESCGVSLLAEDTLVLRCLATDGFLLRRALLPVLDRLTDNTLPICWRL